MRGSYIFMPHRSHFQATQGCTYVRKSQNIHPILLRYRKHTKKSPAHVPPLSEQTLLIHTRTQAPAGDVQGTNLAELIRFKSSCCAIFHVRFVAAASFAHSYLAALLGRGTAIAGIQSLDPLPFPTFPNHPQRLAATRGASSNCAQDKTYPLTRLSGMASTVHHRAPDHPPRRPQPTTTSPASPTSFLYSRETKTPHTYMRTLAYMISGRANKLSRICCRCSLLPSNAFNTWTPPPLLPLPPADLLGDTEERLLLLLL